MTELALDTQLTPEQRDYLQMVHASSEALLEIINDILDFSKIEADKLTLHPIEFDLHDMLGDTLKTLALRAHHKRLELACQVHPGVPTALVGDAGRLRQIVVNLVGNAIKFTEKGEVVLEVGLAEAEAEAGAALLHFRVRDTGMGIPADKMESIFRPFEQADGSITRKYGGTGLGLTISGRLVERMGGRLWVESEVGQGSTFHFTALLGVSASAMVKPPPAPPVQLAGLPVLVVDDNATNRRILQEQLQHWGMRPTLAADGFAALAELRHSVARREAYRLVLLDAMMPEMDGFMVLEALRREADLADLTVMMLSSADQLGDAARCRQLGLAHYMTKPIKPTDLLEAIQRSLGAMEVWRAIEQPGAARPRSCPGGGLNILLAEDNIVNQRLAVRLLEKMGHRVTVANHGRETLKRLEAAAFDLILMDVQMPKMGGFEATARIRERDARSGGHIPIVAMTAHAMKGDRERCREAGMDGYVSKPIQSKQLAEALAAARSVQAATSVA